jgi:hypothetical protein
MVTNTITSVTYVGDGSTTTFGIPFAWLVSSQVKVAKQLISDSSIVILAQGLDYTVVGLNVVLIAAPSSLYNVLVYRATQITQETDYDPTGPFPASAHETALDKLTMIMQEIQGDLGAPASLLGVSTVTVTATGISDGIVTTAKIADANITTAKLIDGSVTRAKLNADAIWQLRTSVFTANGTFTVPTDVNEIIVIGEGGGGGGGGGGENSGGAGGNGAPILQARLAVTPAGTVAVTIGAGGAAGTAGAGAGSGGTGGTGSDTVVGTLTFPGGTGGAPGTGTGAEGAAGVCILGASRGGKGAAALSAAAGDRTQYAAGGTAGSAFVNTGDGFPGGGGGAGFGAGGAGGDHKSTGAGGAGNPGTAAAANSGAGGGGGGGRPNTASNPGAGGAGGSGKVIIMYVSTP